MDEKEKHSRKGFVIVLVLGFVCLVGGFALGWWLCGRGQTITKTTTKIDTIRYYKPIAYSTPKEYKVSLPIMLFAPADTVVKTIVVTEKGDSAKVELPVERREYRDSTYYAIVSGAVVGDRRPALDYIETYNKTITSEVVIQPKKVAPYIGASVGIFGSWSVGVGAGLVFNGQHTVGVEYQRMKIGNKVELNYSYIFNRKLK